MTIRSFVRVFIGCFLAFAGIAHLTFAREEFSAQVPDFVPLEIDTTVVASGVAEIGLGAAMLVSKRKRGLVGIITGLFFVAVFPGNISQWVNGRDGFGLDTDTKRFVRLFFQPLMVWAAIWSTRPSKRQRAQASADDR